MVRISGSALTFLVVLMGPAAICGTPQIDHATTGRGGEMVSVAASGGLAATQPSGMMADTRPIPAEIGAGASGLAAGDNIGGVIDEVFIMAPPDWTYDLETQSGSFVDCGNDLRSGTTDATGRDSVGLNCGVTITETLVIPTAARSARIVIHH